MLQPSFRKKKTVASLFGNSITSTAFIFIFLGKVLKKTKFSAFRTSCLQLHLPTPTIFTKQEQTYLCEERIVSFIFQEEKEPNGHQKKNKNKWTNWEVTEQTSSRIPYSPYVNTDLFPISESFACQNSDRLHFWRKYRLDEHLDTMSV